MSDADDRRFAEDTLAAAAHDKLDRQVAMAGRVLEQAGSYPEALGELTIHFLAQNSYPAVAGLAAAALLKLSHPLEPLQEN